MRTQTTEENWKKFSQYRLNKNYGSSVLFPRSMSSQTNSLTIYEVVCEDKPRRGLNDLSRIAPRLIHHFFSHVRNSSKTQFRKPSEYLFLGQKYSHENFHSLVHSYHYIFRCSCLLNYFRKKQIIAPRPG